MNIPEDIARVVCRMVEASLCDLEFDGAAEPLLHERIEKFATAIARWGPRINLTAKPDDTSELAFHIVDSLAPIVLASRPEAAVIKDAFAKGRRVLDLGSGAGFPALVLASASEASFTLLEARRRRASFLILTAAEMGLLNVVVDVMRRDISGFNPAYDTVTARAYARPAIVFRVSAAALRPGGVAILYVNPHQRLNLDEARAAGLFDHCTMRYETRRGNDPVQRDLVILRKA